MTGITINVISNTLSSSLEKILLDAQLSIKFSGSWWTEFAKYTFLLFLNFTITSIKCFLWPKPLHVSQGVLTFESHLVHFLSLIYYFL